MTKISHVVSVPKTAQELDQVIRQYRMSDLRGVELFQQWQVIRNAALALSDTDTEGDPIPGEDSY